MHQTQQTPIAVRLFALFLEDLRRSTKLDLATRSECSSFECTGVRIRLPFIDQLPPSDEESNAHGESAPNHAGAAVEDEACRGRDLGKEGSVDVEVVLRGLVATDGSAVVSDGVACASERDEELLRGLNLVGGDPIRLKTASGNFRVHEDETSVASRLAKNVLLETVESEKGSVQREREEGSAKWKPHRSSTSSKFSARSEIA
jgi:hypothetical protein